MTMSMLLYQAMDNNENITEWELQFWRPSVGGAGAGVEKQFYTVKLTNASIVDIRFVMPNNKIAELAKLNEYEEIEFIYQHIQWTWVDGGINSGADW